MPRMKKTDIWENFLQTATNKSVRCKHCDKIYKFANVSKMKTHLLHCFKCPVVVRNKLMKPSENVSTGMNRPSQDESQQETSIEVLENTSTSSIEISTENKHCLDEMFSKAVFVSGAPFSMVEHPLWNKFFETLQPSYKLPTRKTISTTHLDYIYNGMVKEIAEMLECSSNLHLQCDGWSNRRNEGIINFLVAKPDPIFVKSVNTLTNRHTSQYLADEILKVIREYGSHKFATIIGDNASNVQKAFEIVQVTHTHIIPLRCVAHTLNLLAEDCMKPSPVQACVKIAVQTIKSIKKSQTMTALLAHIIKEKGAGETLKLPGKTRWGSYSISLKSLMNSKVALQTLAVHEDVILLDDVKTNLLDNRFWVMVESCIKILEPISNKIFKLEGNGILINDLYISFKDIESTFAFVLPDIPILDEGDKELILSAVSRRMKMCVKPIHCAAYLLDPRSQGINLEDEHQTDAMEFICDMAQRLNINVLTDLANYRAKEGIWGRSFIWKNISRRY